MRGIVLDVQSAFVDVQLARDSLALAQENLKALNEIVDVNGHECALAIWRCGAGPD